MKSEKTISRRSFLRKTEAATAGAIAFPHIIPASALGLDGTEGVGFIVGSARSVSTGHFEFHAE